MATLGVALIGTGIFLLYCGIDDADPWQSVLQTISSSTPTLVKYSS